MIGCGGQAYNFDESIELKPGTRRFLDILSERSKTIGVRGVFTAERLNDLGVKNLRVVGCPSVYWPMENGWPTFKPNIMSEPKYATHCTPTGKYRDKIGEIFRYAQKYDMNYICQTEIGYIDPQFGQQNDFAYYLRDTESAKIAREYFRNKCRIFYSLQEWETFLRGLSFVIGSRFHGNIMTMIAGRPCLTLVFDTRTREMLEHFNLPHIHLDDFNENAPIEYYQEMADFSLFRSAYGQRLVEYVEFLDENNVSHKIGHKYKNLVQWKNLDIITTNAVRALVKDAIRLNMPVASFQKALKDRSFGGRTSEQRDAAEAGSVSNT